MNTEKMFVRSITGLPSTVLFAIYIAFNQGQQQITVDDLMGWVMVKDDDSVRQACDSLVALDLIGFRLGERGKKHYHLTDSAQQFLPGMMPILPAMPGSLPIPVPGKSETGKVLVLDAAVEPQNNADLGGFDGEIAPVPEKSETGSSSLVSKSLNSKENLEESNYLDSDAEFAEKTSPELLCKQAYRLFGKSVYCDDTIKGRSIREILAWMAQSYQAKDNLMHPYSVVYRGLRRELKTGKKIDPEKRPDPQYWESPFEFLSYDYLEAVGLGEYHVARCPKCGQLGWHTPFCGNATSETITETAVTTGLPIEEITENGEWPKTTEMQEAAVAWGNLKESLRDEMPKSSFDTWLKDACLLGCKGGTVFIAGRNTFARDWLETRLGDEIRQQLSSVLGFCQAVEFVVSSKHDDGE